jgi:hypothetical protein
MDTASGKKDSWLPSQNSITKGWKKPSEPKASKFEDFNFSLMSKTEFKRHDREENEYNGLRHLLINILNRVNHNVSLGPELQSGNLIMRSDVRDFTEIIEGPYIKNYIASDVASKNGISFAEDMKLREIENNEMKSIFSMDKNINVSQKGNYLFQRLMKRAKIKRVSFDAREKAVLVKLCEEYFDAKLPNPKSRTKSRFKSKSKTRKLQSRNGIRGNTKSLPAYLRKNRRKIRKTKSL